ncbi:VCBS domain-containing protein, partial [Aeromonas salmonicida]|uniref:VCBS domain-containing protein n=1 Tax=Aeromonas salmonicida TaxID=645 RepID=UPI003D3194AE
GQREGGYRALITRNTLLNNAGDINAMAIRSERDGTEHTVTITITGVNDGAEISGADTGAVTEDASPEVLTDSGVLLALIHISE